VWVDANVDGFFLDIDSAIPDYIFSLVDVYRQGKDRVMRMAATVPQTPTSAFPIFEDRDKKTYDRPYNTLPTSNVFGSLTFQSGKVRAYGSSASRQHRSRTLSNSFQELTDEQVLELGAEVFNLPVFSVWSEYRANPMSHRLPSNNEAEPSLLMFKSTIYSSQNTLRPQLLPFVSEVIRRVESRMRRISSLPGQTPSTSTPRSFGLDHPKPFTTSDSDTVSTIRLCFSIRIDQSKLQLTCQPDVNVVAALNWESGGFILNVSPGAREVSFTGSVAGLSIGLKHGFLSEDCVNLDARNLAFNCAFNRTGQGSGSSSVSVVLDTEFLGAVRFSRLQDILCFKAVWLDRIPVFNNSSPPTEQLKATATTPGITVEDSDRKQQGLSTLVVVRIRRINLAVDLGQSISALELDLTNAFLRSKITDTVKELSVFVEDVSVSATGNLSGHIKVPNCLFNTIHRTHNPTIEDGNAQMLELKMTSGALIAAMESDHQKLVHYR